MKTAVLHILEYLKNRLKEHSTWAGFSAAIAAGGTLVATLGGAPNLVPGLCYATIACGFVAALLPTSGKSDDA